MVDSAVQESGDQAAAPLERAAVARFWICSQPFFDTTLCIVPPVQLQQPGMHVVSVLSIYDADGQQVNNVKFEFAPLTVGTLPLNMLLGAAKLQAGLRHGQLVVRSPSGTRHYCRMAAKGKGALLGEPRRLSAESAVFFPITFAADTVSLLGIVNHAAESAEVKCRLFSGNRTPEISVPVPALGARVVNIEAEFPEFSGVGAEKRAQAYLRLGVRGSEELGVQLVERTVLNRESQLFSSVC